MMLALWAALLGLACGSFVAAASRRLAGRKPITGRSSCDSCGRTLGAHELVPVLSYVMLRGRCASCSAPIGISTVLAEVVCAVAFAAIALTAPILVAVAVCVGITLACMVVGASIERRRGIR